LISPSSVEKLDLLNIPVGFQRVDAGLEKLVALNSEKKLNISFCQNKKPDNQLISGFIFFKNFLSE